MTLPGGISTSFTSLGWYYADGYQEQRQGVKIDTIVSPTIAGIRHGKDEILVAALDCLTEVKEHRAESVGLSVYPNPASRQLTVDGWQSAVGGQRSAVRLSIVDLFGREIKYIGNISSFPLQIDISDLPEGVYFLKVFNDSGNVGAVKFVKTADR